MKIMNLITEKGNRIPVEVDSDMNIYTYVAIVRH